MHDGLITMDAIEPLMAFIRAEIAEAVEQEKRAVLKYMRRSDTSASTMVSAAHIAENAHRRNGI